MIAALIGFLIGFFQSVPVGPINVTVLSKGVRESFAHGISVAVGAAVMDFLYSGAAMFGLFAILQQPKIGFVFQFIGFILLVYFGFKNIFSKITPIENGYKIPLKRELHSCFWIGVFLYLSNPSFIGLWITIAGIIQAYHLIITKLIDNLFFAIGAGLGSAAWFYVLLKLFHDRRVNFRSETLHKIAVFSGYTLLAFGCYLGYELVLSVIQHIHQ